MPYSKGTETKNCILRAATELFFEEGYSATTMRQISDRAGTNLGLLKYYFNGKGELALTVYRNLRGSFDALVDESDLRPESEDMFLFSSAVELYLCLESPEYGRFYHEISGEPEVHTKIQEKISAALMRHAANRGLTDHYIVLACTSIAAIKPAIVGYARSCPPEKYIPTGEYLLYYLRQQLHFLGEDGVRAEDFVALLEKYYITVAKNFTPIMVKIGEAPNFAV
ncbi:MAG: TetR/AcrR family transcriptional regulator; helix-turn-helix transcriptional regulator [Oscillospiraceae bacterium]|jgi:AcrR family transcriptional regulator|nr:TetR/AcrR family transcriptional regulator; helix-turn-helix transcriptional regulator [Oscillospiraceae bacterium]